MPNLLKNISIYSLGSILSTGVSFFLLPLYTRVLSPADYGQLELVYLVAATLAIFYGLKVELGYNRIYFLDKKTDSRKTLFMTGQAFNLLCSGLFILILFTNIEFFSGLILNFEQGAFFLKLISLATVLEVLTHIPHNNLRLRHKALSFIKVSIIKLIITVGFTIYFIVVLDLGVAGVLYGKIAGTLVALTYLYYLTWNEFHFQLSTSMLWPMLGFSVFLIPSNLSSLVLNMSNRFFLSEYQNLDDVGLFSLGAKIAAVIPLLITEPVKKAFTPHIFELADEPDKCKKVLSDFIRLFFAGLSVFVLAISVFATDLIAIMASKSFQGSSNVVFILAFSKLLLGLAALIVLAIHITRKTWIVTIIWVASSFVNVALNIWLIPEYGRMGAAYATMLSILFILIMYIIAAHKVFPLVIPYFSLIKVLAVLVLFNYLGTLVQFGLITNILLKVVLTVSYAFIILVFTGVITNEERNKFRMMLKKRKAR